VRIILRPGNVATVLVIASDPNIESLAGELVAFAGHRPLHDVTVGASGESIRRSRPDVTMLDTTLAPAIVIACLAAADEVGSQLVLISSTATESELANEARLERRLYFALPRGPRQLARVLEWALAGKPSRQPSRLIPQREDAGAHTALCAALASVARARALVLYARATFRTNRILRDEHAKALTETQRSRAALRAAVVDFTQQLKAKDLPIERALLLVHDTIVDCANVTGADSMMPSVLGESDDWARDVYAAA